MRCEQGGILTDRGFSMKNYIRRKEAKYTIKRWNARQRQCRRATLTDGKQNFEEILRSPILITVSRGERQGCCRECSRFFTVTHIFLRNIDFHAEALHCLNRPFEKKRFIVYNAKSFSAIRNSIQDENVSETEVKCLKNKRKRHWLFPGRAPTTRRKSSKTIPKSSQR